MDWNAIGEWAEEMDAKARKQRRERLGVAADHFGLDLLDILGDSELEARLLTRYEDAGLAWPPVEDSE